ncbi:MAG TPA: 16S rRNA (guanine(966)-N(2))-methyltransferase RsmD [Thermodesulfobacteriota bacterium]|jgi:16S rRNA (guanine(966)-N(2))-methyltransferase RsmD|nr:16S rRNA (guanine(966)-N(2))-methyltransferase RsmD [Thermodesulfobacteriota bacterium]
MLRVLTGKVKGRRLKVPKGQTVRPTTSRVKKTIFDMLGDISGLRVLDLFAGSGSLGIEALSRGASHVTFIEKNPFVYRVLKENLSLCGFLDRATLICAHYEGALKRLKKGGKRFDLVFIDPPYISYGRKRVSDFINEAAEVLEDEGIIVIEHNYRIEDIPTGFKRTTRSFGGTQLSFFRRDDR